jgi:hypothetical protein
LAALLAFAAVLLALGPTPTSFLVLSVLALAVFAGMAPAAVGAALGLTIALHAAEARQRRHRRRHREAVRAILEALSESTRLEGDLHTQVLAGLRRSGDEAAHRIAASLEAGSPLSVAFAAEGETFAALGTVLAHCRLSGTHPAFALSLLRQELLRRWRLTEESEATIGLMRSVASVLAIALLGLTLLLTLVSPLFSAPEGTIFLAFVLITEAVAVLAPRAVAVYA